MIVNLSFCNTCGPGHVHHALGMKVRVAFLQVVQDQAQA